MPYSQVWEVLGSWRFVDVDVLVRSFTILGQAPTLKPATAACEALISYETIGSVKVKIELLPGVLSTQILSP